MDTYTILCAELRGTAQKLNGNIEELQKKADKLQKAINKATCGDYKASDLSAAYTAQRALTGSITRLGEICGAMNAATLQFSEASAELSGRANLTAYFMQHTDTLDYNTLMGSYSAAITSAGSATAGYELIKSTLSNNGYTVDSLGAVSNALQNVDGTISAYESDHPDTAKKMDKLLQNSGLWDADIKQIKYLVYTAPEPYRTAYINNLGKYKVDLFDKSLIGNSHYWGVLINVARIENSPDALSADSNGAYTTFFHESGHAIDDVSEFWGNETASFKYNGSSLYEIISEDVRGNISDYMQEQYPDLTAEQSHALLRSMNLTDDAEFRYQARDVGLSDPYLDNIRTEILDHYWYDEMVGNDDSAVCDIYNGVTNEVFFKEREYDGWYGHHENTDYWYHTNVEYIYGIDRDTYTPENQTGNQAEELWAEFFAAQMTKNEAALRNIREHFPKAYEAMEKMAAEMAKG